MWLLLSPGAQSEDARSPVRTAVLLASQDVSHRKIPTAAAPTNNIGSGTAEPSTIPPPPHTKTQFLYLNRMFSLENRAGNAEKGVEGF